MPERQRRGSRMAAMGSPRHLRRSRACRSGLLVQRSLDGSGLLERQGIPARSGGWIGMLLGRTTRLRTCPECEQIRRGNPARLVVVHARTVGGLRPPSFDRSCILRLEATVFVGAWWPAGLKSQIRPTGPLPAKCWNPKLTQLRPGKTRHRSATAQTLEWRPTFPKPRTSCTAFGLQALRLSPFLQWGASCICVDTLQT